VTFVIFVVVEAEIIKIKKAANRFARFFKFDQLVAFCDRLDV